MAFPLICFLVLRGERSLFLMSGTLLLKLVFTPLPSNKTFNIYLFLPLISLPLLYPLHVRVVWFQIRPGGCRDSSASYTLLSPTVGYRLAFVDDHVMMMPCIQNPSELPGFSGSSMRASMD